MLQKRLVILKEKFLVVQRRNFWRNKRRKRLRKMIELLLSPMTLKWMNLKKKTRSLIFIRLLDLKSLKIRQKLLSKKIWWERLLDYSSLKLYLLVGETFLGIAGSIGSTNLTMKLPSFWILSWLSSGLLLILRSFCRQLDKVLKSKVVWRKLLEISLAMHVLVSSGSNLRNST